MVYAKTKLPKLPESCKKCAFSEVRDTGKFEDWRRYKRICKLTGHKIAMQVVEKGCPKYVRPVWCPLIEVENENEIQSRGLNDPVPDTNYETYKGD